MEVQRGCTVHSKRDEEDSYESSMVLDIVMGRCHGNLAKSWAPKILWPLDWSTTFVYNGKQGIKEKTCTNGRSIIKNSLYTRMRWSKVQCQSHSISCSECWIQRSARHYTIFGKVIELRKFWWATRMKVIWYWPIMRAGWLTNQAPMHLGISILATSQEPLHEGHSWIDKEFTIFLWVDEPPRNRVGEPQVRMSIVLGLQMQIKICISSSAKPHLLEYMAMWLEAMKNSQLEGDVDINM